VATLVAALVAADLATANRTLAPTVDAAFYERTPEAVRALREDRRGVARVHVERFRDARPRYRRDAGDVAELCARQRDALVGVTGLSQGLDLAFVGGTEGGGPLEMARLRVLLEGAPWRERAMLLGAGHVSHVVTFREAPELPWWSEVASLEVGARRPLRVLRNELLLPRARVAGRVVVVDGLEGLARLASASPPELFRTTATVTRRELALRGVAEAELPRRGGTAPAGRARVVRDGGHLLVVEAEAPRGGLLVVADAWLREWRATVGGRPAPILRVDGAFRGVLLDPGRHEVVMRYVPAPLR
jgi:hypothetical protein